MINKITPIVFRQPWEEKYSVILRGVKETEGGQTVLGYAEPILFRSRKPEEDGQLVAPAIQLTKDEAQALMDQLWSCGLRPTEGSGGAGSLAATERHLADMQKLTFKLLEGAV